MENNCLSEILFLHDEIQETVRTSLDKAIRIGQLLTQQKAELGHGEWGLWFDDNLAGTFSRATANNYMKLYEERDRLKILNVRNIAAGLRIIYGKTKVQHSRKGQFQRTRKTIVYNLLSIKKKNTSCFWETFANGNFWELLLKSGFYVLYVSPNDGELN
jgi:hypothetical protein